MTLVNRLEKIFPGFGQPVTLDTSFLSANTALTSGQNTTTLPSTGSWSPTISTGKVRIKVYNGSGTAAAVSDVLVTATDGTTTVTIYALHPNTAVAISTTAWFDIIFDFETDLNLTSMAIKVTLTGSSPTASGDFQVAGTI